MTDLSTAIRRGDKGDATLLRPTFMCMVPLILDRVCKNLKEAIAKKGATFQKVFNFCYNQKLKAIEEGFDTHLGSLSVQQAEKHPGREVGCDSGGQRTAICLHSGIHKDVHMSQPGTGLYHDRDLLQWYLSGARQSTSWPGWWTYGRYGDPTCGLGGGELQDI